MQKNSENSLTRIFFRAILLNNYKKTANILMKEPFFMRNFNQYLLVIIIETRT
ncbi:hypothetical protein RV03_GL000589 [Enterococcus gallinarum]|nr:hypothetical protein RV03_GL000589 [Enterococcus gallinarum]